MTDNLDKKVALQLKELEKNKEFLEVIKKSKLSPEEAQRVIKGMTGVNPHMYSGKRISFSDKHVRFGIISDPHMGHRNYRPDALRHAYKNFKRSGVEFIVNGGDTIEGMSGREGHIYELSHIGASEQLRYFQNEFKELHKIPVYSIEAQDSHGGWFHSKGNAGLNIGEELESRAKNYNFLGYDEQDLTLDNGLIIRLRHPGGGTAYAVSYKMQKYAESIDDIAKPDIIVQGHFHKANYMFYRGMHCIDAGALQDQSPFMKKKGSPSHVGYWIIDAQVTKSGKNKGRVEQIKTEFVPC